MEWNIFKAENGEGGTTMFVLGEWNRKVDFFTFVKEVLTWYIENPFTVTLYED